MCHRDLKLENTLLDGRTAPRLKICDFGYSKVCSSQPSKPLHSLELDGLVYFSMRHLLHAPEMLQSRPCSGHHLLSS